MKTCEICGFKNGIHSPACPLLDQSVVTPQGSGVTADQGDVSPLDWCIKCGSCGPEFPSCINPKAAVPIVTPTVLRQCAEMTAELIKINGVIYPSFAEWIVYTLKAAAEQLNSCAANKTARE
jgi:hypothetical protein